MQCNKRAKPGKVTALTEKSGPESEKVTVESQKKSPSESVKVVTEPG